MAANIAGRRDGVKESSGVNWRSIKRNKETSGSEYGKYKRPRKLPQLEPTITAPPAATIATDSFVKKV